MPPKQQEAAALGLIDLADAPYEDAMMLLLAGRRVMEDSEEIPGLIGGRRVHMEEENVESPVETEQVPVEGVSVTESEPAAEEQPPEAATA